MGVIAKPSVGISILASRSIFWGESLTLKSEKSDGKSHRGACQGVSTQRATGVRMRALSRGSCATFDPTSETGIRVQRKLLRRPTPDVCSPSRVPSCAASPAGLRPAGLPRFPRMPDASI